MFSLPLDWAFCIYRVSRSPYFYSSPKQTNQKSPACVQPQATDATNHWNFNDDLAQFHNLQAMNQSFSKTLMYMAADHTIKMQPSAKQSSYNSYTFVNVSRWNAVLSELYLGLLDLIASHCMQGFSIFLITESRKCSCLWPQMYISIGATNTRSHSRHISLLVALWQCCCCTGERIVSAAVKSFVLNSDSVQAELIWCLIETPL